MTGAGVGLRAALAVAAVAIGSGSAGVGMAGGRDDIGGETARGSGRLSPGAIRERVVSAAVRWGNGFSAPCPGRVELPKTSKLNNATGMGPH